MKSLLKSPCIHQYMVYKVKMYIDIHARYGCKELQVDAGRCHAPSTLMVMNWNRLKMDPCPTPRRFNNITVKRGEFCIRSDANSVNARQHCSAARNVTKLPKTNAIEIL